MAETTLKYNNFNPNAFWLLSALTDTKTRYIVMQGGSSSSKSFSFSQVCLLMTARDGCNTLVLRKVAASNAKTIYEDFKVNATKLRTSDNRPLFRCLQNKILCADGGRIDFAGMDDSEKIKGISNYKRIFMEELSEFDYEDWRQIRTRMRGIPNQKLVAAFNPISEQHWIKREVFDKEKWDELPNDRVNVDRIEIPPSVCKIKAAMNNQPSSVLNPVTGEIKRIEPNFLWLVSTYMNNFWVVGSPDGSYGYFDVQTIANYEHDKEHDPDYYRVYALGEWGVIRTGGELLPNFSMSHVKIVPLRHDLPVHVSVDDNVLPYITTTIWQYDIDDFKIRQVGNVCAREPRNNVTQAAQMVCDWLHERRFYGDVYLHGDVTTKKANTIDENRQSFFDKYKQGLERSFVVHDVSGKSNPSVALSSEFIDKIFAGEMKPYSIEIDEACKESIDDYLSVKKDVNGGLLKVRVKDTVTKQSYEQFGHCTDTMRYAIVDILKDDFTSWSLRRKHNPHSDINYINQYQSDERYTFIVPSFDDVFSYCRVAIVGERIIIEDAFLTPVFDASNLTGKLYGQIVFEATKPFLDAGKKIREQHPETRLLIAKGNADERIKATMDIMKDRCFFVSNDEPHLQQFIDNLLDYNGKESREAANILALVIQYINRKLF